ncbi:MAG: hypothetical protein IJO86_02980 [Oscillospiraceae bacterium]|nr:hypothetical protein [Oscillospiraceae bacterium]
MKKIISLTLVLMLLFSFTSCSKKVKEDEMTVTVINNSKVEIYGISFDVYVNDDFYVSKFLANGTKKKIAIGESITLKMTKEEFKNLESISGFNAKLKISKDDLTTRDCNNSLKFIAHYGDAYTYSLTGDFAVGFYVHKVTE